MENAEFGIGFHLYTQHKYNCTPTTAGDKDTSNKMHTIRQQCICNRRSVPAAKEKSSYIVDPHKKVSHSVRTTPEIQQPKEDIEKERNTIVTIINKRVKEKKRKETTSWNRHPRPNPVELDT